MSAGIALVTCLRLPEPDPDAQPLLKALRQEGAEPELAAWDDPAVQWGRFDVCVIRSTWDYIHRLPDFLAWVDRAASKTKLLNPARVVRWNTDKSYLRELEARGVPVVPTLYLPKGWDGGLDSAAAARAWKELVAKPRIGAASFATRRFGPQERAEAERFLVESCAERDMMLQPYLRSVELYGERSLVWIRGEFTHAVRKTPRFAGEDERVSEAVAIAADERAFGEKALASLASELLYARVDLARDDSGALRLMELELVEPSLFLVQQPAALARLARACVEAAVQ